MKIGPRNTWSIPDRRRTSALPSLDSYPLLSRGAAAFAPEVWQALGQGLKLTPRELQMVQHIFDDDPEAFIATTLGISVNTVRTELRRLRHKLHVGNRVRLVLCVMEEFLRQAAIWNALPPARRLRAISR